MKVQLTTYIHCKLMLLRKPKQICSYDKSYNIKNSFWIHNLDFPFFSLFRLSTPDYKFQFLFKKSRRTCIFIFDFRRAMNLQLVNFYNLYLFTSI